MPTGGHQAQLDEQAAARQVGDGYLDFALRYLAASGATTRHPPVGGPGAAGRTGKAEMRTLRPYTSPARAESRVGADASNSRIVRSSGER